MYCLKEYPDEDEFVVCTVREIRSYGAVVTLDEYNNREGFIHISEVATGWVKYIRDYIKENQKIVCKTLRVEKTRGLIDLTLKGVGEHQKREKIQIWKNEQKAMKYMEILCKTLNISVGEAMEKFGKKLIEKYGTLYTAFEETAINPKKLKTDASKEDWIDPFIKVATENIVVPEITISGILEITSLKNDGINRIKNVLLKTQNIAPDNIKITYISSPKYKVTVKALSYKEGEKLMKKISETVTKLFTQNECSGKFIRT